MTAGFLTVFTGRKTFITSALSGLTAVLVLTHIESWSAPYFLPQAKPYRDPLPPLTALRYDRSTPRSAFEALITASREKNAEEVAKSFSQSYRSKHGLGIAEIQRDFERASPPEMKFKGLSYPNDELAIIKVQSGSRIGEIIFSQEGEDWLITNTESASTLNSDQ